MRSCLYLPSMEKGSTFASGQNANRRFFCVPWIAKKGENTEMIGPIELCQPSVCLAAAWKYLEAKLLDYYLAGSAEGLEANWSPKHISSPSDVHCSIFVVAYRFQKELISASSLACRPRKHFNNKQFKSIHHQNCFKSMSYGIALHQSGCYSI